MSTWIVDKTNILDILLKGSGELQSVQLMRWEKEKEDIDEKIRKFENELQDTLGEEEAKSILDEGKRLSEDEFRNQMKSKNEKVKRYIKEGNELSDKMGKKKRNRRFRRRKTIEVPENNVEVTEVIENEKTIIISFCLNLFLLSLSVLVRALKMVCNVMKR